MADTKRIRSLLAGLRATKAQTRDLAGAELADLLDADQVQGKQLQLVVRKLTEAALAETDHSAKESMFNALSSAGLSPHAHHLDLAPIARALEDLEPDCLEHALIVLGESGDAQYRGRIEKYLSHSDEWIRRTAAEALEELQLRGRKTVSNQ